MDVSILDLIFNNLKTLEGFYAYSAILLVLLGCGLGVPIPEDITLVTAGWLSFHENIDLYAAIVIGTIGVLIGDFILFSLGRRYGPAIMDLRLFKYLLPDERAAKAREMVQQNSKAVCFCARFLAGLRAPIYLTSGILGVKTRDFLLMDSLAALISVPLITFLGYYFGDEIETGLYYMRRFERTIMIGILLLIGYFIFKKFMSHRKNQLAKG